MNRVYWQLTSAVITVCIVSAVLLGGSEALTRPRRDAVAKAYEARLRGEALVGGERGSRVQFGEPYTLDGFRGVDGAPIEIREGTLDGEPVGKVFTVTTMKGYSGQIDFIVGVSPDDETVTGIRVVNHAETPGLGANATEIRYGESDPWFASQFAGKAMDALHLKMEDPNGEIDALTGATITSRAITERARQAFAEYREASSETQS